MAQYSILIADDDDLQRKVQKLLLSKVSSGMNAEFEIEEASDSVQTRALVTERKYDLIVLDNEFKDGMKQGHLPGIALLQLMRKDGPNTSSPAVFLSADSYDTLKSMVERFNATFCQKAKVNADEMIELYTKLLKPA